MAETDSNSKKNKSSPVLRAEFPRKIFHLAGLSIPLAYLWLPEDAFKFYFTRIALFLLFLDLARLKFMWLRSAYLYLAAKLLRPREWNSLSGSFYFLLGCLITVLLFPKTIAIASMLVLIISDTVAALVGQRLGKHKIGDKSIEGSAAFFFSAWLILVLYFGGGYVRQIAPAFAAALVEFYSHKVHLDDNLSIPIIVGSCYMIMCG